MILGLPWPVQVLLLAGVVLVVMRYRRPTRGDLGTVVTALHIRDERYRTFWTMVALFGIGLMAGYVGPPVTDVVVGAFDLINPLQIIR